jgi:release factor glutamine methyltransferase
MRAPVHPSGCNPATLDVRGALRTAMVQLCAARVPSHALAAELLLMHVLGRDRAWLYAHPEEAINGPAAERYFEMIAQRAAGTPTQYLIGHQEFWGLDFEVEPGVLIPRPESEHLVEVALERLGRGSPSRLTIADVGTGTGCLALSLARELPQAMVYATDISEKALTVARHNARRLGVAERVHFVRGSLLEPFLGAARFNLVVSNPPYVARSEAHLLPREVREHEPEEALYGGLDGSQFYEILVTQSGNALASGGVLVVELGYNALSRVRPFFDDFGTWRDIAITDDLAGIPRVLAAAKR